PPEEPSSPSWPAGELCPGTAVGDYQIEAPLGKGGMASVYSATHRVIGKRVAIKVISRLFAGRPGVAERFIQEARAVNHIRHPNIVDIFDIGKLADDRPYLVMEWLEGETLHRRMQRGRIPLDEAISILLLVTDALEAVHEAGVVH